MIKIPPLPDRFTPDAAPVGIEIRFVPFMSDRPEIDTDAIHYHTNAAQGEGTVDSAWRHIMAAPGTNTLPHYQVDRTHDGKTRACKFLRTDLRGIGSTTVGRYTKYSSGALIWPTLSKSVQDEILSHPNVRDRTIVVETADTGTIKDPAISPFDDGQLEVCATIAAFESITHGFPRIFQEDWTDPGIGSHTDPRGFPYTTIHPGKICPGLSKKDQVRNNIIQRAKVIADAWMGVSQPDPEPQPEPQPEEEVMRIYLAYHTDTAGKKALWRGNGIESHRLDDANRTAFEARSFDNPRMGQFYNPLTEQRLKLWSEVPTLTANQIWLDLGHPR
jgi:hypothetical protein